MHGLSLPPCDIDAFHVDFISWSTFRDLFTVIYVRNSRLSDIERLCYLIRKSSGRAKEIVYKFPLTSRSFELAWRAWKNTYNPRMPVNDQLKKLFNISDLEHETRLGLKTTARLQPEDCVFMRPNITDKYSLKQSTYIYFELPYFIFTFNIPYFYYFEFSLVYIFNIFALNNLITKLTVALVIPFEIY